MASEPRIAVLVSGGLDSAVLLVELARSEPVVPVERYAYIYRHYRTIRQQKYIFMILIWKGLKKSQVNVTMMYVSPLKLKMT